MNELSIAIETTCRRGGLALGVGDELVEAVSFDASQRHATQLVARLAELLDRHGRKPADLAHLYVSAGPGSFTGTRVGITVARTLALAVPALRLARVATIDAVAQNAADLEWQNLGVALDSKDDMVYAGLFARRAGRTEPQGEAAVVQFADFLAAAPRPLLLIGEAMAFVATPEESGLSKAPDDLNYPTAQGVWHVARRLAAKEQFTDAAHLLPIYSRQPEAVRLWEKRQ